MNNAIMVTGATGFLGRHVVRELSRRDCREVVCFVRATSDTSHIQSAGFEMIRGDLNDAHSLTSALRNVGRLVNLASLGFGHAPNIVCACEQAGVSRAVYVSTTAIYTTLNSSSKSTRIAAERAIEDSSVTHTILRPTMIYGSSGDRNISRLIRYLYKYPILPVFGNGNFLQQPVFVTDVASATLDALESTRCAGRSYDIPGGSAVTFNELVDIICQVLERRVAKIHIPFWLSRSVVSVYGRISANPRLTVEQVLRLNEDKAFDFKDARNDFGYSPLDPRDGIEQAVRNSLYGEPTPMDEAF